MKHSDASSPTPTAAGGAEAADRLLEFLRERDTPCPLCGYNLRNLTLPRCPECRQHLELTVGVRELRFGWLLAALAPGLFSGIAALLLLLPIIIVPFTGGPPPPLIVLGVEAFGLGSGIAALVLIRFRFVYLKQRPATQRWLALSAWAVHIAAFILLFWFTLGW